MDWSGPKGPLDQSLGQKLALNSHLGSPWILYSKVAMLAAWRMGSKLPFQTFQRLHALAIFWRTNFSPYWPMKKFLKGQLGSRKGQVFNYPELQNLHPYLFVLCSVSHGKHQTKHLPFWILGHWENFQPGEVSCWLKCELYLEVEWRK